MTIDNWNELIVWCTEDELAQLETYYFDGTVDVDVVTWSFGGLVTQ